MTVMSSLTIHSTSRSGEIARSCCVSSRTGSGDARQVDARALDELYHSQTDF